MSFMVTKSPQLSASVRALRRREGWLRAMGVVHAAVFGSVARGDDRPSSDVDVLVELAPQAPVGTPEMLLIESQLQRDLGRSVDVVSRGGLRSPRHDHILEEMVLAF
jgi:predicted nucleotidyltransferase